MSDTPRTPRTPRTPGKPVVSDLERELGRAEYEPLLPVEKRLIAWSLGIGVTLLVVLLIVGRYFPAS